MPFAHNLKHLCFILILNTLLKEVSGDCLTFTPLGDVNGSVLSDYSAGSCLTIPSVTGVTPLLEIQLASDCRDRMDNHEIKLQIALDNVTMGCEHFDGLFSELDNDCCSVCRCEVHKSPGTAPNGTQICNASCDCPSENCRLMLLANPGWKSTGWNVCEISPIPETTTTTTTSRSESASTATQATPITRAPVLEEYIICEGGKGNISCPEDQVINVFDANYGRQVSSTMVCPVDGVHNDDINCVDGGNAYDTLTSVCNGKTSCELEASNEVFGDTCGETYKYLEVTYMCRNCR